MPTTFKPLAMQVKSQVAALEAALGVTLWVPGAAVLEHDGTAAILALRNCTFERAVIERMVFDMDREAFVGGVEAWPLCDRPALQHAIHFKAKIIVEAGGRVFLDQIAMAGSLDGFFPRRLARLGEVTLGTIGGKLSAGGWHGNRRTGSYLTGERARGSYGAGQGRKWSPVRAVPS
jgi:hypothetical protein